MAILDTVERYLGFPIVTCGNVAEVVTALGVVPLAMEAPVPLTEVLAGQQGNVIDQIQPFIPQAEVVTVTDGNVNRPWVRRLGEERSMVWALAPGTEPGTDLLFVTAEFVPTIGKIVLAPPSGAPVDYEHEHSNDPCQLCAPRIFQQKIGFRLTDVRFVAETAQGEQSTATCHHFIGTVSEPTGPIQPDPDKSKGMAVMLMPLKEWFQAVLAGVLPAGFVVDEPAGAGTYQIRNIRGGLKPSRKRPAARQTTPAPNNDSQPIADRDNGPNQEPNAQPPPLITLAVTTMPQRPNGLVGVLAMLVVIAAVVWVVSLIFQQQP